MSNKTITAPKGFQAAGLYCGVKQSGNFDLGMIICPTGVTAAAVFTTNKVVSAAVTVCREHTKSNKVIGVVVNSGNANTCTGNKGIKNANQMCSLAAAHLNTKPENILVASTGIIGVQLPIEKIAAGIDGAVKKLSSSESSGFDFVKAIMTTDTKPKQAFQQVDISGKKITIAGTVKGAGMIGPNMATTLLFITTDAAITKPLLSKALKATIDNSLNKLTVDIHQSTNDTGIIMASGLAGNKTINSIDSNYKKFANALMMLCDDLAKQMALDAEGATRMFKVEVKGAASKADARKAARAVADYPLVKCAVHGSDPNWGRIICAVGSCGVQLKPEKLSCKIGGVSVFRNGQPAAFNPKKVSGIIAKKYHTISIDLGIGKYDDFCYGCDLSREYVTINADYHT